jgi:hypothetical protein
LYWKVSFDHGQAGLVAYQVHDDFTIGMSLESSWLLETLSESDMVVDLSVDGEYNTSIIVDQGLSTSV